MCPQTSSSVSEPLSFPPQKGNRTLDSLSQCPGGWYPKKGRVRPRLRTQHSEPLSLGREEPRGARAQLRTESPDGGWGGPRQEITELHPVQELEACRPIMASEWPLAGKGCPAELQTAVTMENLPSPPRQLPACLHARPRNCSPRPPPAEPNGLSHTAGSADLAPGRDSWCQAGQIDQLLIWCGQGRGGEEGQELRLMELEEALENPGGPHDRRPERAGPAPDHTAHKRLTTQRSATQDVFLGHRLPSIYPPGPRSVLKHGMPNRKTWILLPLSWYLGTSLGNSEPLKWGWQCTVGTCFSGQVCTATSQPTSKAAAGMRSGQSTGIGAGRAPRAPLTSAKPSDVWSG